MTEDLNEHSRPTLPPKRTYRLIQAAESRKRAEELRRARVYAIDGWIQTGKLGVLSGLPKIGKSTLMFETVCAMATGSNWLDLIPVTRMPVILFAYENDDEYWWENFDPMLERRRHLIPTFEEYWYALHPEFLAEYGGSFDADIAEETIEEVKGQTGQARGVFIIDTGRAAWLDRFKGEGSPWELNPMHVRAVCTEVKQICRKTGWAGIIIHHDTKSGTFGSGSSEWLASVDYGIHYTKERNLTWNGAGKEPNGIKVKRSSTGVLWGSPCSSNSSGTDSSRSDATPPSEDMLTTSDQELVRSIALEGISLQPGMTQTSLIKHIQDNYPLDPCPGEKKIRGFLKQYGDEGIWIVKQHARSFLFYPAT